MSTILIADDVPAMREQYAYDLARLGSYETMTAAGGAEALAVLEREPVDCMILDLEMPDMDGFEVLKKLQARGDSVPVIVYYTGTGNYDRCVRAVQLGAYGFIDKAEPVERVVQEIENALEKSRLAREVTSLRRRLDGESSLIGTSPAMGALKTAISRLAPIPSPILIIGESGSGKELVARELHRLSGREREPFFAVNCAALSESLIESELFGHERGAFTGADRARRGAFEAASQGTLFLDEIGELKQAAQAKLLRVLEEGTVTRLGGSRSIAINTRVLAATHRDLDKESAAGNFREDLLFRINAHVVRVPPLRERLSDLPLLVDFFLHRTGERFRMKPPRIAAVALDLLARHEWRRNNVRELRNVIESMVIAAGGEEIAPAHVPGLQSRAAPPAAQAPAAPAAPAPATGSLRKLKADAEREIVLAALERNGWHITHTAEELGLADHASLLKVMKRHGLKRP